MDFKVNIEVTLTEDRIASILVGAMEGGSNYWIDWITYAPYKSIEDGKLELRLPIEIKEDGEITTHTLTREKLQKGLELLASTEPYQWSLIYDEQDDASTADILLQLSLFGEIVYG